MRVVKEPCDAFELERPEETLHERCSRPSGRFELGEETRYLVLRNESGDCSVREVRESVGYRFRLEWVLLDAAGSEARSGLELYSCCAP